MGTLQSKDILENGISANHFGLGELLDRASSSSRSSWIDIPEASGIYIVYFERICNLTFSKSAGQAKHSIPIPVDELKEKWESIVTHCPTDIVYIGKGEGKYGLRQRIRQLIRFGAGKANNHQGGRQMWQIEQINRANLAAIVCDHPRCVEKCLLEQFIRDHEHLPLANEKV